jgi:hypothetical protein
MPLLIPQLFGENKILFYILLFAFIIGVANQEAPSHVSIVLMCPVGQLLLIVVEKLSISRM